MGINKDDVKAGLKEAKDKAINAVKAFFKFLKDFAFRNSIAEKLEEIEAQLQEGIENDMYTQEQLKKLTSTMDSLAGQLRNMSPEAMKETAEKAAQEINDLINEMYGDGRILSDVNEEDFFTAMKNISGHGDMTNEQFRDYFEQNAKLLDNGGMKLPKGQAEGKTTMLIELGDRCFQATFDVSEPKATAEDPEKKKREYTLTVDKFDGSYGNAKEITSKADINKHETMMRKFILPRGLRRPEDIKRFDISKLVKTSTAIRDVQTIEKFSSGVKESQDGKYEFFYDTKSNAFRARDKETNEMLIVAMKKGELIIAPAQNADSVEHIDENKLNVASERSNFKYEAGKGIINFDIMGMTDTQMAMFRTPEMMQFLETKGIPTTELKFQLEISDNPEKRPRGYSKVSREGLPNVDMMYRALYEAVSHDENPFDTRAIRDNRKFAKGGVDGAVYLSINDKEGNTMSVSFEKDGTPRDINYRPKGGKFQLAQNLGMRGNYGANFETLRYDESFAKLFDTFKTAYNLYKSRTQDMQKGTPAPQKVQTDKATPAPVTETPDNRADYLLKNVLHVLQESGRDVEAFARSEETLGFPKAESEAVKAILLDYEVDKGDIDKLIAGKGLKSKRMLENMKEDLTHALEALDKELPETPAQETEEAKTEDVANPATQNNTSPEISETISPTPPMPEVLSAESVLLWDEIRERASAMENPAGFKIDELGLLTITDEPNPPLVAVDKTEDGSFLIAINPDYCFAKNSPLPLLDDDTHVQMAFSNFEAANGEASSVTMSKSDIDDSGVQVAVIAPHTDFEGKYDFTTKGKVHTNSTIGEALQEREEHKNNDDMTMD